MLRLQNQTNQVQQISFIKGKVKSVLPNKDVQIDESKLYQFELDRILKIFKQIPVEKKKSTEKKEGNK